MYTKVIVSMAVGFALIQTQVVKAVDPPTVAWWRMQDMQNGVIPDATGNGHDLTINGTPTFQGNIVIFSDDGTLETPDSDALDLLGDWSVSYWVREDSNDHSPNSNPTNGWMSKVRSYGDSEGGWFINGSEPTGINAAFYGSPNCNTLKPNGLTLGAWYRLTTTFDSVSGTLRMYLNQNLVLEEPVSCPIIGNTYPVILGGFLESNLTRVPFCKGAMADVRIYDRVLSELEIGQLVADTTCDDFEDGVINPTLWAWGGLNRATSGGQGGSWQWSNEEVIDPGDGYLSMRVWGPTSGNTFGAEAWVRTLYDYNDGSNHLINFTWNAEVQDTHYNRYHIQVTDGYISPNGSIHWPDGAEEVIPGTTDLLWRVSNQQEFPGASYPAGLSKSAWSMTIDSSGLAVLYDGPDATGLIIRAEPLNLSVSWYARFMVLDATSSGFPAGDIKLNLYDFCASGLGLCGNGVIDTGEACDDGNTVNCDGCRGDCSAVETGCGDGFVCGAELCDDGNLIADDGCSSNCLVEGGHTCSGEPSVCTPCDLVDTGLIAHWRMNERQGNMVPDASGHGHDLTINGSPTFQDDIVIFNDDGTLETPDSDELDLLGDWSVSYWAREDSGDHPPYNNPTNGWMSKIVAYADAGGGWFLNSSDNHAVNATFYGSPNCNHRTVNPLVFGRWYRLTTTFDSIDNTIRIYFDGTLEYEASPICSHGMGNNNTPVLLGGNIEANMVRRPYCKGAMADVRIYNRVLDPCEIDELLLPGSSPVCGDGAVAGDEECDDGNLIAGDGCSALCTVEPGFICSGEPSMCNQPPQCDAGGAYMAECQGGVTTIGLDGSGSVFDPLTYLWSSDCPGENFNNATIAAPTLFVNTPPDCSLACNVSLTVTDSHGVSDGPCGAAVTIEDATPPVLVGVPLDATVECDAVPLPANVTATDTCDPSPTLNFAETIMPGACPQESVITRTWTATDACGNTAMAIQTLTVVDNTAPVFSGVPADTIVECGAIPAAANVSATDNCDHCLPTFFSEVQTGICSLTLTRTWEVADACGNTATETQMIMVQDTTPPMATASLTMQSSGDNEGGGGDHDDDEGIFVVVATCSDNCEGLGGCAAPIVSAVLMCSNGQSVAVTPGAVVEIEAEDEGDCEIEMEHGRLEIEGEVTLVVTCTDASGNTSTATAVPVGLALDNDDDNDPTDDDD